MSLSECGSTASRLAGTCKFGVEVQLIVRDERWRVMATYISSGYIYFRIRYIRAMDAMLELASDCECEALIFTAPLRYDARVY